MATGCSCSQRRRQELTKAALADDADLAAQSVGLTISEADRDRLHKELQAHARRELQTALPPRRQLTQWAEDATSNLSTEVQECVLDYVDEIVRRATPTALAAAATAAASPKAMPADGTAAAPAEKTPAGAPSKTVYKDENGDAFEIPDPLAQRENSR
eukprot:COSAG01_NODE_22391_length_857_cov_4.234828_1_plen_158_part_00